MEHTEKQPKLQKKDPGEPKVKAENPEHMSYMQGIAQDNGGIYLGLGILSSSSGGFGVKTKTLNILKKSTNEEKRRGRKPYSQVIEETGAHLVDLGQVVGLPERYFKTQ
jgi:hypothetical protein